MRPNQRAFSTLMAVQALLSLHCLKAVPKPNAAPTVTLEVLVWPRVGEPVAVGRLGQTDTQVLKGVTWFVQPYDKATDVASVVEALKGKSIWGLSLARRNDLTEENLALVAALPLGWLDLSGSRLSAPLLRVLAQSRTIRELRLDDTQVGDAELGLLAPLALRSIDLRATRVTNAGVKLLATWPRLEELGLTKTQADDTGLQMLEGRVELTRL
jgi:hypothetical protein